MLFAVAAVVAVVLKTGDAYFYRSYSSIYRSIFAIIVAYMDLVTLLSFIYMYIKLQNAANTSQKPETEVARSQKPKARSQKPEARSQKKKQKKMPKKIPLLFTYFP